MTAEIDSASGWLLKDSYMWWFVAAWLVAVLVYGVYRSLGGAEQDPIRPSGPFPKE